LLDSSELRKIAIEITMITPAQLKRNRNAILKIAASHGAQNLRIFGSVARGQAKQSSDLDVLITLEPGRSLLDLVAIKQDLEDLLDCAVDVVTEDAVSPHIREQVLKDAVSL
jgi:predicted nucleotidyltransferase